jgi:hypothetical protein
MLLRSEFMSRSVRILLATITALAIMPVGTAGATITVANTNDLGPGSLRQAIVEASPGETIIVPAGTYTLTSGELSISKSLDISGHGSSDTIIRSGKASRVFEVSGAVTVTISGVTIRDGEVSESNAKGGGLLNSSSGLALREVVVTHNLARASSETVSGGGIWNSGKLTLIDSSVTENVADASGGSGESGGIAEGGGVSNESDAELFIEGSTISGNTADARGAPGGEAKGGGVFATITEPGSISASTVSGNLADAAGEGSSGGIAEGGGLMVLSGTSAPLTNLTIAANTVRAKGSPEGIAEGGGLLTESEGTGEVTVNSATIASNKIDGTGGGIDEGTDLFTNLPTKIENTIVSAGVGPAESGNCAGEKLESQGFNLDTANDCGFNKTGDQVNTDPQLGPLQGNEGPAPTMAPAAASPVVDHGSAFGISVDERGKTRPVDLASSPNASVPGADGSDIGAVELQGPAAVVIAPPPVLSRSIVPPDFDTAVFLPPKTLFLRLKCPARFKPGCVGHAAAVTERDQCARKHGRVSCKHGKPMTNSVSAKQKPNQWKVAVLEVKPQYTGQVAQMATQPDKKLLIVHQLIHSKLFKNGQPQSVFHIYRVRTATSG